jgi:hypothetical protein
MSRHESRLQILRIRVTDTEKGAFRLLAKTLSGGNISKMIRDLVFAQFKPAKGRGKK